MENNLARYAALMTEMKQNGWDVHLLADITIGERTSPSRDVIKAKIYRDRIEADKRAQGMDEEKVRDVLKLLDVYAPHTFNLEMAATITTAALKTSVGTPAPLQRESE
jgi:hypothetical protein